MPAPPARRPSVETTDERDGGNVRLRNYVGGRWVEPPTAVETLDDVDPASGEVAALVPLSGAAEVDAAVAAARAAQPGWRAVPPQERARAVLALREELLTRAATSWPRWSAPTWARRWPTPTARSGAGSSRSSRRRRSPHLLKGETLEGVARRRRRRAGAPAGRRGRRDHPVQLPGDDPALVPALRDRLRQHLRPQALRAGPAAGGADRRAGRRGRGDPGRRRQPRPRRPRRGRRRSSTTRGSTPISFVGQAETARHRRRAARAANGKRVQALGGAKNSLVVMPDADLERAIAGDHGLRLRRRRPALPGRLGLRRWSATRRGGARSARRWSRRPRRSGRRRRRPGDRRLPDGLGRGARAGRGGDRRAAEARGRRAAARRPRRRRRRPAPCSARRSPTPPTPSPSSPATSSSARC